MDLKIIKITSLMFILFVAFNLVGCSINDKEGSHSQIKRIKLDSEQEKSAGIETEIIQERRIKSEITIPAQFRAISVLMDRVYEPVSGKVVNVFVEPGAMVKKGQPLIEIKSDEIAQIQLAFLDEYIMVDSSVKQMGVQYNLSKLTYKRENELYREGIASRAEYEVAYAQLMKDKASLNSLISQRSALIKVYSQRIGLYGGNENTIKVALRTKKVYPYITLRSNKNGVVLSRKVNPGEFIDKNKELFDIADLSSVWLVGYAFEKDAPLLKVGQVVTGVIEGHQFKNVHGNLYYVASILDEERKTLEVIATIPNPDREIKPNMYAEMIVDVGEKNALAVPNTALQRYGDYTFAYVKVKPNLYEERKVEIGHRSGEYSEVKSGLKSGEMIVSKGGYALLGECIKVQEH